jgi:hypothetical protein
VTFTIYEKHPTLDAYRYGPSFTPYAIVAVNKDLSDAELSAEYQRAKWTGLWAEKHGGLTNEGRAKIATVERFATLPHAHETNYE